MPGLCRGIPDKLGYALVTELQYALITDNRLLFFHGSSTSASDNCELLNAIATKSLQSKCLHKKISLESNFFQI